MNFTIMNKIFFYLLFILFPFLHGIAQKNTGRIVDSKTGESIPYANIQVDTTESLISNADGFFSISENNTTENTIIAVSYLGYTNSRITLGELKKQQNIIKLNSVVFELDAVTISNEKPDAYSIMIAVRKNLETNYKSQIQPSKEVLFYRESNSFTPKKMDIEITKSTGFTKQSLKLSNAEINTLNSNLIIHPPKEFTDVLCNFYKNTKTVKDKNSFLSKIEFIKATNLKDDYQSANVEDLEEILSKLILKHLDTTKYYRVKSGLFGSRDSISLREDFYKNRKNNNKRRQAPSTNSNIKTFLSNNDFLQNNKLDFVTQPELYEYHYEGATYSNNNEFTYVLTVKPKKSKAKYTGKLYISETDYAVLRTDFTLSPGKTLKEFNMKLLLGVKYAENISKGTLLFERNSNGNGYYLRYASREKGYSFYVNRPLKFIELSDSDKDVLALDTMIEGNTLFKKEVLTINSPTAISNTAFSEVVEKGLQPIKLKKYDPSIWKGINTIEPLQEMKQYKTAD
jgi:hypothetical protein